MSRRYPLHALQGLQTALGLSGLRRLGPESFDERLHVLDLALLTHEERRLLGEFRRTLIFERRVVASVRSRFAVLDVDDAVDDAVEKLAVVRDQKQGARILA